MHTCRSRSIVLHSGVILFGHSEGGGFPKTCFGEKGGLHIDPPSISDLPGWGGVGTVRGLRDSFLLPWSVTCRGQSLVHLACHRSALPSCPKSFWSWVCSAFGVRSLYGKVAALTWTMTLAS
jgi:hypothetical protein